MHVRHPVWFVVEEEQVCSPLLPICLTGTETSLRGSPSRSTVAVSFTKEAKNKMPFILSARLIIFGAFTFHNFANKLVDHETVCMFIKTNTLSTVEKKQQKQIKHLEQIMQLANLHPLSSFSQRRKKKRG